MKSALFVGQGRKNQIIPQTVDAFSVFICMKIPMLWDNVATITCDHAFDIFIDAIFQWPRPALAWHCDASSRQCIYHSDDVNFAV